MIIIVPGIPAPGGSKRPVRNKYTGKTHLIDDCKRNPEWRAVVALKAQEARVGGVMRGPLRLSVTFVYPRPKNHYRTGKNAGVLRPDAPKHKTTKPDTTKLLRSTEDALTGIAWVDDSQVVEQWATKIYGDDPGAVITIEEMA